MLLDPKVILKKQYLDKLQMSSALIKGLSGEEWYNLQATRAFNQAIGRVIRHSQDYGNIILIDDRFSLPQYKHKISTWMRDSLVVHETADQLFGHINQFFGNISSLNLTYQKKTDLFSEAEMLSMTDRKDYENPLNELDEEKSNEEWDTSDEDNHKTLEVYNESSLKVDKSILKNSRFKRKTKRNSINVAPLQFSKKLANKNNDLRRKRSIKRDKFSESSDSTTFNFELPQKTVKSCDKFQIQSKELMSSSECLFNFQEYLDDDSMQNLKITFHQIISKVECSKHIYDFIQTVFIGYPIINLKINIKYLILNYLYFQRIIEIVTQKIIVQN